MKFEFDNLSIKDTIAEHCKGDLGSYCGNGFVRVSPSNCILPRKFQQHVDELRDFQVRENDVYLVSSMKTGTEIFWKAETWIWLMPVMACPPTLSIS